MLLVTYQVPGTGPRLGLVREGGVADLTALDPAALASFTALLAAAAAAGTTPARWLAARLGEAPPAPVYRYADLDTAPAADRPHLLAPLVPPEVWAAGVTYKRSLEAREVESKGNTIYDHVYTAVRPELFFKATGWRVVGPGAPVGLRSDSRWQVPEPELGLVLDGRGGIAGYTIGNDMSSRDIEGECPLYLPQAKIWRAACALGPAVLLSDVVRHFPISMAIRRGGQALFTGETHTDQMRRTYAELVAFLHRDNDVQPGTVLLTGTCIVPPDDFTLCDGDVVEVSIGGIGTLRNTCRPAAALPAAGRG